MSDIGVGLLLFACLLLAVAVIRFFSWLTELQEEHGSLGRAGINTVKRYVEVRPRVMSRSDVAPTPSLASSLQTDSRQTADKPATVKPGRAELLTLYSTMRAAGITRDQARPALKAVGLPLDNNLWADAAPPESPHVTPIVGRPTSARFETDADYPYQSPA
jgi:hypothetical protein